MVRAGKVENVLILGGGDGLAAREVLRYPEVRSVTLVDLDPVITGLATNYGELAKLNRHAMTDPRMRVVNGDAMQFLTEGGAQYDVVVVDFPDPNNFALGKLYTTGFYKLLKKRIAPDGVAVVQSTSPLFARRSFWCVETTLKAAGFWTEPYHALVPSFGEWGYVLIAHEPPARHRPLPEGLLFLDDATMASLTQFPPDMGPLPVEVNRLNNQVLVHYYEAEWQRWN